VLLSLTLLMMVSGAMVAFAPNTAVFMAGRALVGVVIGGFWSMSAATVMRPVPESQVLRALGLLNAATRSRPRLQHRSEVSSASTLAGAVPFSPSCHLRP